MQDNKIGEDVTKNPAKILASINNSGTKLYENKILEVLREVEDKFVTANEVSKASGISWTSCSRTLLNLYTEGKVEKLTSGNRLFFRIKQHSSQNKCDLKNCNEQAVGTFSLKGFKKQHALCEFHRKSAEERNLLQSQK